MPQILEVQELKLLHPLLSLTDQCICTCLTPLLGFEKALACRFM